VIAVVGVFGIPQFAPAVASSSPRADGWTSDEFSPLQDEGIAEAFVQVADDLFAPIENDRDASLNAEDDPFAPIDHELFERQTQAGDRTADSRKASTELPGEALEGWTLQSQHDGASITDRGSKRNLPPDRRRSSLTWRTAVGRLNSLGIRHFRLSPGERPREFHFSCFFTPADNTRITHRFEAEANEPLEAVKQVLAQIDDWLAKR
jgi:hypothetical protein